MITRRRYSVTAATYHVAGAWLLLACAAHAWPSLESSSSTEPATDATPPAEGEPSTAVESPSPTPAPDLHDRSEAGLDSLAQSVRFEAWWERGIRYRYGRSVTAGPHHLMPHHGGSPLIEGRMGLKLGTDAAVYARTRGLEDVDNGINLRRLFVYSTGQVRLFWPVDYKFELGTVTQDFFLNSAWLQVADIPYVGALRIGQFTTPQSLQMLMSSRDLTLMESGSPVQAFAAGTRVGLQAANNTRDRKWTWAYGWFANSTGIDTGDASDSLARLIGRLTWLPVYDDAAPSNRLLHLGVSGGYTFTSFMARYQTRPESFLAPILVDSGEIDARQAFVLATELLAQRGRFTLEGEAFQTFVDTGEDGSRFLHGFYVQGSWMLSDQPRPYDRDGAYLGELVPKTSFEPLRGKWGTWEVAGRASFLDLDDGAISGGKMAVLMAGLNWYWNRYVRFQYNVGWADVDGGVSDGGLYIFQTRLQLYF